MYSYLIILVMENIFILGFLRVVFIVKFGLKLVNVFILVDVGSGFRYWVKVEKVRDFKCWV